MPCRARSRPFGPTAPALVAAALWSGSAVAEPAASPAAVSVVAPASLSMPASLATARPPGAGDGVAASDRLPTASDREPAASDRGLDGTDRAPPSPGDPGPAATERAPAAADPAPAASERAPPPSDPAPLATERAPAALDRPPADAAPGGAPTAPRAATPLRDDAIASALWGLVEQSQRLVRAYAQLGTEVRAASAATAVTDALRAGDRALATLGSTAQRRVAPARVRELELRWRALRDAVGTRPAPPIARLMDDVARQLAALAADSAAGLPPASRSTRQRTLLHRMAGAHLLACWGALPPAPAALLAMRAEFGHLLADGADAGAGELDAATLASQWGLLADGLDGHGPPCDAAASARVASTADRLAQLLDASAPRPFAARRP
jgi:hypothetical protein